MPEYYAISDADRIHDYVFSASQLKLIRGASVIQLQVNRQVRSAARTARGQPLRSSGGTVVAVFESPGDADEFCKRAKDLYREYTHIATATTAVVQAASGGFGTTLDLLFSELENGKNIKSGPRFSGSMPFWVVCESCGLLPASAWDRSEPSAPRRVCSACHVKEVRGRSRRRPRNFEWLGEQAKPENYIGIIYIDLDRLGRYVRKNAGDGCASYRLLSADIDRAVRRSVRSACRSIPPVVDPQSGRKTDCYEVLIAGGDDAIVAVPAQHAFKFLLEFERAFNWQPFRVEGSKVARPSFSAGIVLAHSHFPIAEFIRLAEDLLRSAKNIECIGEKCDSVDYAVITASMTQSLKRSRITGRTAKPYTLKDMKDLLDAASALKRCAPSSKIRALYQVAHESEMQAELDYLNILWRLEAEPRRTLIEQIGDQLWKDGRTKAADLAELWELV
jgi:hypothetical protein